MTLSDYSDDEASIIKTALVVDNPNWVTAMSLGKSVWGMDHKLRFYTEINDTLRIPIGCINWIQEIFPNVVVTDNRYASDNLLKINFSGELWDYQEKAVDAMVAATNGVLCAITGSGKTVIACNMISRIKQPTLILVDTVELANQFAARLKTFTKIKEVGVIGQGKENIKPVTVAILQTLNRWTEDELQSLNFGMVIADEVHIIGASTYTYVISNLNAKYKYGLSATPERADGLTKVIFWLTGDLAHTVLDSEVADKIIKPTYESIETDYFYPLFDSIEYGEMITDMGTNADRNKLIVDTVNKYPKQQCVLLCHRQDHVELLSSMLPGSAILLSKTKKKDRLAIIKSLESGVTRIVVTTWQLFHKGIDLAELELLFICAPTRSKVWLKQSAGRLMRVSKKIDKHPKIIDFADIKVDLLKYQFYARRRVLTRL